MRQLTACVAAVLMCCTIQTRVPEEPSGTEGEAIDVKAVVSGKAATSTNSARAPMRVGGGVKAPVVIHREPFDYTFCSKELPREVPVIELVIDETGTVLSAAIVKAESSCWEKDLLPGLLKWRFKPGEFEGQPVPVIHLLTLIVDWN